MLTMILLPPILMLIQDIIAQHIAFKIIITTRCYWFFVFLFFRNCPSSFTASS